MHFNYKEINSWALLYNQMGEVCLFVWLICPSLTIKLLVFHHKMCFCCYLETQTLLKQFDSTVEGITTWQSLLHTAQNIKDVLKLTLNLYGIVQVTCDFTWKIQTFETSKVIPANAAYLKMPLTCIHQNTFKDLWSLVFIHVPHIPTQHRQLCFQMGEK